MNQTKTLMTIISILIGINTYGQGIGIAPIEESVEILTGSSIDNKSAVIELKAQSPSSGRANLALYNNEGASSILFSDDPIHNHGYLLEATNDPMKLTMYYGTRFYDPEISLAQLPIMTFNNTGQVQFGTRLNSPSFIDITTPHLSNFTRFLSISDHGDSEPFWSVYADRVEQHINHHLTGNLDISDGTVVVRDGLELVWSLNENSSIMNVDQYIYGTTFQSQGSNNFAGPVNINNTPLTVNDEITHLNNDGWQLRLANDNEGSDDSNNWYIGSSHDGWNIGDDKLVFSRSNNSGTGWIMYLNRSNEVVSNQNGELSNDVYLRINGSAYATGLWVTPPSSSLKSINANESLLSSLSDIEVYNFSNGGGNQHFVKNKSLTTTIQKNGSNPSLANEDDQEYVNYTEIIAITVGALKELNEKVIENYKLEERIAKLEKIILNQSK